MEELSRLGWSVEIVFIGSLMWAGSIAWTDMKRNKRTENIHTDSVSLLPAVGVSSCFLLR